MTVTHLACACGKLRIDVEGAPIISGECYCDSCRAAGARLAELPIAGPLCNQQGGTRFAMYRKDRIRFAAGAERFKQFRLSSGASTRRVVTACCNTPVFLEFEGGHWLDLYGCLWNEDELPPLQVRTFTGDLADPSVLPTDVPNLKRHSLSFYAKLMTAWIKMRFHSPKIEFTMEQIDA